MLGCQHLCDEAEGPARPPGPGSPPHTVDVIPRQHGQVIVEHCVHCRDVQASAGDICGQEQLHPAAAEPGQAQLDLMGALPFGWGCRRKGGQAVDGGRAASAEWQCPWGLLHGTAPAFATKSKCSVTRPAQRSEIFAQLSPPLPGSAMYC